MTAPAAPFGSAAAEPARRPLLVRTVLASVEGRVGLVLAVLMIGVIAVGPLVAAPTRLMDAPPASPPSAQHLLGTDAAGRDVLSRVLTGGSTVVVIPLIAVLFALVLGGSLGLVGAFRGGRIDTLVTGSFDLMLALPPLLVVLVVIAGLGSGDAVLVITVGIVFAPSFGRVVRAATQTVVVNAYVSAAKARGERMGPILARDVLPNVAAPVLAECGLRITYAILFVSGLSFLGLGVQPPSADWGLMIAENRDVLAAAPLSVLAPAAAITLLALSFNLLSDALSGYLSRDENSRVIKL